MKQKVNIEFGRLISQNRKKLKYSQAEFADVCGVHRTYIGAIERGEKSVSLVTLQKLFTGLNIPMERLWEVLKTD